MARILIYSLVFPPDGVSTGQIMGELAIDLVRSGHSVSVVTTQPHYNRDETALARQPLTRAWGGLLFKSSFHGIQVVHTRMPPKGEGIRSRLLGWALFHVVGFAAALRFFRGTQVVIVPSPLLSAGVVGWLIGVFTRARYIYNVQELYPDLGIQLGRLRNPVVIGAIRVLERFVYRTAAAITVITHGMFAKLLGRGVPTEKLHYVPNFVDLTELKPLPRTNAFSVSHNLTDRFVVSYAGNMGYAQGLEVLLDAAEQLRDSPRVAILLVGNGVARASLVADARRRGLENVMFVEHQPYERVPEIYASSDLSVVSLLDTIGADAIPSKVYRIMACARPLLAIASPASELATVVNQSGCGLVVPPDATALAAVIRAQAGLSQPERDRQGLAGRAYVLAHVERSQITRRYSEIVEGLTTPERAFA